MLGLVGGSLWMFGLGFVVFANSVMRAPEPDLAKADGIVVLTGGQTRIAEAAKLLNERRGKRLLISGVNKSTSPQSLKRIAGLADEQFDCCIDLGYSALTTIGNALETKEWAETKGYKSLIVVTATYHMPRSITELALAMPNVELIPHPVQPVGLRTSEWWLDAAALRVLGSEYVKFLPAATRLAVARAISPWHASVSAASASMAMQNDKSN